MIVKENSMAENETRGSTTSPLSRIRIGLMSALIAGALVGIIESIVVVYGGSRLNDWWMFCWAAVTYGLLALPVGLGFGVLGAIISKVRKRNPGVDRLYSFYLSLTFTVILLVIARFRIIRDVYNEFNPGLSLDLKLLVGAIILFTALHFLLFRFLLRIRPFRSLPGTGGSIVAYLGIIAVTAIVAGIYGASGEKLENRILSRTGNGPNILLIIVDTLRADHLSCYGYDAIKTPSIDGLAADGILYRHTFSQASWTRPSIASIMTGLYPSTHQTMHKQNVLPDEVTTLAEALAGYGYATVGMPNNENIFPIRNFQQGFQVYDVLRPDFFFFATESAFHLTFYEQLRLIRERFLFQSKEVQHYYQDAVVVGRHASRWLDALAGQDRFFLFIHYMEPHDPYFRHPYDGTAYARVNNPHPSPAMAATYRKTYDGEITYLDRNLGELLRSLKERGLYDDMLIVFTADHGEEFHEHGGWWHGTTLYEEQIHVPLIIKLPKNRLAGTEEDELVRSIDISPTILHTAGAPMPGRMQGHDILPDSTGTVHGQDYVYSEEVLEQNDLQSVRGRQWKLILANEGNPRGLKPTELYDLPADPHEMKNLAASERDRASFLHKEADSTRTAALKVAATAREKEMGEVERERLKALGYVQ